MSRDNRKRRGGFSLIGWIIWIAAAIILFIIFIANKNRIVANLKATGFFDRVFGSTPEFIAEMETPDDRIKKNDVSPESDSVEISLISGRSSYDGDGSDPILYKNLPSESSRKKKPADPYIPEPEEPGELVQDGNGMLVPAGSIYGSSEDEAFGVYNEESGSTSIESAPVASTVTELAHSVNPNLIYEPNTTDPVKSPVESPAENVSLRLFFIEVNTDGTRNIKEVTRLMKKTSTPLTDSINALIDGPTPSEEKSYNCRTMVSPGTRLLSASVKNGIATLNFSEEFEFNNYGIEGVMWELDQIVYTATAFPSVEKVQFIIEGTHREYLSEGLRIGEPLGRDSL